MRGYWLIALALVGCGEDEPPPPPATRPPVGGVAAAPGAAGAGSAAKGGLVPLEHIEDRVTCPVPKKVEDLPTAPEDRCDVTAPSPCKDKVKKYCLPVPVANNNAYCFACPERDNIRHVFKESRDFAPEQNRDPFESFVLSPQGIGSGSDKPAVDVNMQVKCNDKNSWMASFSYVDLKLVGIVTQGTLRKGLITGGRTSAIIKRNDCVGKEKAIVKEVGDGFATFVTQPDPNVAGSRALEHTVLLRANTLALNASEPSDSPSGGTVPSPVPGPGASVPSPQQPGVTRVEIPSPKQPPAQPVPSVDIKP